jgi:hypothetical protein
MKIRCDHLGSDVVGTAQTTFGDEPIYQCSHPMHEQIRLVDCVLCEHFYRANRDSQHSGRHPHGVIVDRYNRSAGLADLFYGAKAFAFLGGPSTKQIDLTKLSRRGVLLLSVNNCPASLPVGVRPQVWLHTDPTGKFHHDIWKDPGVIKLTPTREWMGRWSDTEKGRKKGIRKREGDEIVPVVGDRAHDQPGVLGFYRNTNLCPENWLWEPSFNRGNDKVSSTGMKDGKQIKEPNGWPHTINTMFCLVRTAFYLGIKRLYLVGCDFKMDFEKPYGFDQGKSPGGCRSNNSAYLDMIQMFDALEKEFKEAEFEVVNTNPESRLWTFPMMPFDEAIEEATGQFEQVLDARDYYDD